MKRKRVWEVVAGVGLLVALAGAGCGFLYLQRLNAALEAAVRRRDAEAAYALLRRGANGLLPAGARSRRDLLLVAVRRGNVDFVRRVLGQGIPADTCWSGGHSALMYAAGYPGAHQAEIVRLLLEHGALAKAATSVGFTALHLAANGGSPRETIPLLLAAGVSIDAQDRDGRTPLMYAARLGDAEGVRTLLEHGANLRQRNVAGRTALQLARRNAVVKLLEQAEHRRSLSGH